MFYIVNVESGEVTGRSDVVFEIHPSRIFIESELTLDIKDVVLAGGVITLKPAVVKPYNILRREAYPSLPDQLDSIFHNGIDAWKAEIQAVKDLYPKPEVI